MTKERTVRMFDPNDARAALLFDRITQEVITGKKELLADRANVARFNRLLR